MICPVGCAGAPWRRARKGRFCAAGNESAAARAGREMPYCHRLQGHEFGGRRRAGAQHDRRKGTGRAVQWTARSGAQVPVAGGAGTERQAGQGRHVLARGAGPSAPQNGRQPPLPARLRPHLQPSCRRNGKRRHCPVAPRLSHRSSPARCAIARAGAGRTCPSQAGLPFSSRAARCRHRAPGYVVARGGPARLPSLLLSIVRAGAQVMQTRALCA